MKLLLGALLATCVATSASAYDSGDNCETNRHGLPLAKISERYDYVADQYDSRLSSAVTAFTFEDGPNTWATYTTDILDLLAEHGVKATWFVLGNYVDQRPDLLQAIVDAGHEVGVQAYTHVDLTKQHLSTSLRHIHLALQAIEAAVPGHPVHYWRPPYGETNQELRDAIAAEFGLSEALWTLDTLDWDESRSASQIASTLAGSAGHVVLMQDGVINSVSTVEALKVQLPSLVQSGLRFMRLSDLDLAKEGCFGPPATTPPSTTTSYSTTTGTTATTTAVYSTAPPDDGTPADSDKDDAPTDDCTEKYYNRKNRNKCRQRRKARRKKLIKRSEKNSSDKSKSEKPDRKEASGKSSRMRDAMREQSSKSSKSSSD
ncbi:MAG: hypothetical protein MHM6MM_001880 [Cercozoa sp. M6MM]